MSSPIPEIIETPDGPMTRREAAARYKLPYGTLVRRLWLGWPPERAFGPSETKFATPPIRRRHKRLRKGYFMTPWGRMGLARIALRVGMSANSLKSRLYHHRWPIELAFNTPPFGKPGVNFIMPPAEYRRLVQEHHRREHKDRAIIENGTDVRVTFIKRETACSA